MSEYIVHTAIAQDCFAIVLASGRLCSEVQEALQAHRSLAEAASVTKSGDLYTWRILEDIRSRWPERTPAEQLECVLAFVLGWVSHRAADRQMKPVFRALVDPETRASIGNDCTLYNEAKIYTEYYLNHENDPYKNVMALCLDRQAFPVADTKPMENLFQGMLKMSLMRMHTLKPSLSGDALEIEDWIRQLAALLQTFDINVPLEAQIVANPDPDKYRKYIVEANFFLDSDPLILCAKKLRFGTAVSRDEALEAMDAPQRSDYATALQTALRYVCACNDFFAGAMDAQALRSALDIGRPGRDGASV